MKKRTRQLGLVFALSATALMVPGGAGAAPPPMPKLGMVCSPGGPTFNIVANTGHIQTPDGNSILMWSYANADVDGGHFQTPGPVLCVTAGQTVTIHLHNTLPEPVSMVFPGQDAEVAATGGAAGVQGLFTEEAVNTGDATGDVTYTFTAGQPGTYLYESGSDISKQLEMGLYGALIVRPAGHANWAYDSSTQFDPNREYLLLLNEIDPDLHHAVETGATYDPTTLRNRYFAVNGREFPDTIQDNGVTWLPNQPYGALVRIQPYNAATNPQPALIRLLNVGEVNHPFHPHGNHLRQIAQDGRLVPKSEHFGETIGSGQTEDFLLSWTDQDNWNPATHPFPAQLTVPSYQNLTFKDGDTFYSGNRYLGMKGTLPTGTVSHNICGEWYFPMHSHALHEFTNFDEGFGGMATMMRVDPLGGCTAIPASAKIFTGALRSGTFSNLAAGDSSYYRINSTTTGTRTTDWSAGFTGLPAGAANLKLSYTGRNCNTSINPPSACALTTTGPGSAPAPSMTVKICNFAAPGAAGCTTAASPGWVNVPAPNGQTVGSAPSSTTWTLPAAPGVQYVGTGSYKGQVKVRVQTTRSGTTSASNFTTWADFMQIVYDAP
jgi:FtsP/CotA-like multicopper oxidase with cupredoxin domain